MGKSESPIFYLKNKDIRNALEKNDRVYFIGDLKKPQTLLDHLNLGPLEVGSTLYQTARADVPHMHGESNEIMFVLSGRYDILIIDSGEEYQVEAGDFISIPPQTAYAGKATAGTQTFFIKHGGNDKIEVEVDDCVKSWMNNLKQ